MKNLALDSESDYFLNVNLILICPNTFGMCRLGEHALREGFSSLNVHSRCDENAPKLKLTDSTLTLSSLQRLKVIMPHNPSSPCDATVTKSYVCTMSQI